VIALLVAKELDTVWNGESLRETHLFRSGSFRAAISIGEQDRARLHSAGARSLTGWMIWHSRELPNCLRSTRWEAIYVLMNPSYI